MLNQQVCMLDNHPACGPVSVSGERSAADFG